MVADAASAATGTLSVRVTNVRNARGRIHVDICPEAKFLKDDCPYSGSAAAEAGTVIVRIEGVPEGRYAAQLFHDENGNDRTDRGLFGIPTEGVGFSNDAPIRLAPPRFADAVFAVPGGPQTISVRMRYFTGPSGPPERK
ncbi:MAG: hypothetical protein DI605_19540 [Sphingomonas sp.]|nr:MAG: hypothetical protein DI605_19540 [Sphingomonas sp.]